MRGARETGDGLVLAGKLVGAPAVAGVPNGFPCGAVPILAGPLQGRVGAVLYAVGSAVSWGQLGFYCCGGSCFVEQVGDVRLFWFHAMEPALGTSVGSVAVLRGNLVAILHHKSWQPLVSSPPVAYAAQSNSIFCPGGGKCCCGQQI